MAENQTDFIFAVAGEEYGFIGCVIIVLLLLAIAFECIRMSLRAKDLSGKVLCCGIGGLIALQSFINICVATGLAPNTELPSFVSHGIDFTSLYIVWGRYRRWISEQHISTKKLF
ncbi:MAG: FtsW/RodA/SpoVE family cell cycle protein [Blautia wexlerae]